MYRSLLKSRRKPLIFYAIFGVSFGVSSCSAFRPFNMRHTAKVVLKTAGPREKLVSVLVSVWIVLLSNFLHRSAKWVRGKRLKISHIWTPCNTLLLDACGLGRFPKPQVGSSNLPGVTIKSITVAALLK